MQHLQTNIYEIRSQAYESIENIIDNNPQIQTLIDNLPAVQEKSSDILGLIFIPRTILRQLILWIALDLGAITVKELVIIIKALASHFSSRSRLIRQLQRKQQNAPSQDEWMDLAEQMDSIQGNDTWRSDPNCALYESDRIAARMDEYVHLMRRQDIFDLMFTLRGGIGRNKFGLLHPGLFTKAMAGSKLLVETYHNVVCAALDYVCDAPVLPNEDPIPTDARLAFFNETRHSYGRTALLLSGGAALGFYHVGVVKALMENGLMPRVLSGASAGSIVCAMVGTRTNEECTRDFFHFQGTQAPGHYGQLRFDFFRPLESGKEKHISNYSSNTNAFIEVLNNPAGAFKDGKKTWQTFMPIPLRKFTSAIYDVITGNTRPKDILMNDTQHFRACCKINIGNFTFQEAFDRTGRILNITVSPQNKSDPPRLLNYLTAPHVLVWSAAVASSSLPGVFQPNKLLVKNSDGTERYESASGAAFLDGSMEADLPMQHLSEMFNINHFIISQANPHAIFFSPMGLIKTTIWSNPVIGFYTNILRFVKNQVKAWVRNIVELVGGQRVAPIWDTRRSFVSQFFTQEYEGRDTDITLNPWSGSLSLFGAFMHILYNPRKEEFLEWIRSAERVTWKHIPEIKSHIAEEITLDQCVQRLRRKLVKESWEAKMQRARSKQQNSSGVLSDTTDEKLGQRVPSFFTSPSLVNMSGLGIGDRLDLKFEYNGSKQDASVSKDLEMKDEIGKEMEVPVNSGWDGRGLSGNRSLNSLDQTDSAGSGLFSHDSLRRIRSNSSASGIFVDASDDESSSNGDITGHHQFMNNAWDRDILNKKRNVHATVTNPGDDGYVKTCSMAEFYYSRRRSCSQSNLQQTIHLLNSDESKREWKSSLDLSEHAKHNRG